MRKNIKLRCAISIILLIIANIEMMLIEAYANNFNTIYAESSESKDYSEFAEIKEDYQFISDKVNEELSVDSSEISNSKVESFLNDNGVFDDEILGIYGEEDIKEFENMDEEDIDNMSVSVSYFAVEDIELVDDKDISSANTVQLTDEEVDMYIAEKYYGQDTGLEQQILEELKSNKIEKESKFEEIMENIGLKTKDAYAETQTKQVRKDGTVCMLKKVVTCTKPYDDYVDVRAVVVWDKMPVNRKLDSIGIRFDNAIYERDAGAELGKVEVTHFYTKTLTEGPAGKYVTSTSRINKKMTETESLSLKENQYNTSNLGVTIALKLTTDEDKLKENGDRYKRVITNEGIRCKMYVRLISKRKKGIGVYEDYIHIKTTYNPIETLISLMDKAFITVTYRLINGKDISVSYDKSGVNEVFPFNFK